MMGSVVGIGSDLISQQRVAAALDHLGDRFARRILTPSEMEVWNSKKQSANYLAKQFAAKEALSKALGTGIAKGVSFQDFEVSRADSGQPLAELSGAAKDHMQRLNGAVAHISLTDEGDLIMAFAVISA